MKKIALLLLLTAGAHGLSAQTIDESELRNLRGSFQRDASTTALQNAVTAEKDLRTLTLNRELQGKIDHLFKYRVKVSGITDQLSSGRCWMFTSMNVLRPSVMEQYNIGQFDFSHNYLYFYDLLEKSNLFLENIIRTARQPMDDREVVHYFSSPLDDGGVWNLYYNIARKYGVVPAAVMPETEHSNNTTQLNALLKEKLRREGYLLRESAAAGKKEGDLRGQKTAALKDVYRILALCLGEPPTEFAWRYREKNGTITEKSYTPQEFYTAITPSDYTPDNYIMIMNDPTREYYKVYEILNYRNSVEGVNWVYLNLPNDDIKRAALASIKNDEGMYASCDVGKQLNRAAGIMDPAMYDYESLFGVSLDMPKSARILTRQSGSSHAMMLMGCDTDANDVPVKWEFENSWGPAHGNRGYLTFTDAWFDEYMFRLVIHRKYLDAKAVNALKQAPVQLPPWDYMF
ncbi:C1 family peptidase [Alistipes sp. OttesenSCG-928-L06]|nr:C1 family peptidase [Alistipes sp. OttesenSCG-928-L06]